jgi:aerobic-type carbon monoxide dehydrogenase small subunit (CoxS/CutS family)
VAEEEKVPIEGSEEPMKISRRDFLVGAGAGVVVTGVAAVGINALRGPQIVEVAGETITETVTVEGETITETVTETITVDGETITVEVPVEVLVNAGPSLPATLRAVNLTIDGNTHSLIVDVRESLWETMTKELGMQNTALGCDRAQCGACTVLVDGRSMNGCTILTARMGRGQQILTVDSLSAGGTHFDDLHPIQQEWVTAGGGQCGICTRGFIMTTHELLSKNLNPTETDVKEALAGNICRCGNYTKIYDSVFKAAETMRAAA